MALLRVVALDGVKKAILVSIVGTKRAGERPKMR